MITDEMLQTAAAKSSEAFVRYIEQDYDPGQPHEFSSSFKKKMKKLKRMADRPLLYRSLRRVASVILAILIGGGIWLTVDIEARAAFFGWVKEICETYFVYRFEATGNESLGTVNYRPTWLPDGYSEFYLDETEGTVAVVYADEEGSMLKLNYTHNPNATDWFINTEQVEIEPTSVHGQPAELLIAQNSDIANAIMWTTEDNTAFYLSAFLDKAELIKVAEEIQIVE